MIKEGMFTVGLIGAQNSHTKHFCETINKKKEALDFYKEIKANFPKAKQGEIDKFIYRLSIEKNDFSVN